MEDQNQQAETDKEKYQMLIGSLMYLAQISRPDILTAVNMLSRYLSDPREGHWYAAERVLRYIKETPSHGIFFNGNTENPQLIGYSDANWGGDIDTSKSTSGYLFLFMGGCLSARSKLQETVATSTLHSEWIATYHATTELIWLKNLMKELGWQQDSYTIYTDNMGVVTISKNPEGHQQSKHMDIKYRYIRECVEAGLINIKYIATDLNIADIFTKGLPNLKFLEHRNKMVTDTEVTQLSQTFHALYAERSEGEYQTYLSYGLRMGTSHWDNMVNAGKDMIEERKGKEEDTEGSRNRCNHCTHEPSKRQRRCLMVVQ